MEDSHVRHDEHRRRECHDPPTSPELMAHHASVRRNSEHVSEAADADDAALDAAQLHLVEQHFDVVRLDVAMPMKMREDASVVLGLREIHDKDAATR